MSRKSREKGKRGEREAAKELVKVLGCEARRGQQFSGGGDSPDVVTDIPGIHFEVKRVEAFKLWDAIKQAESDCAGKVPVVLHRKNGKPWVLVVRLSDVLRLVSKVWWFKQESHGHRSAIDSQFYWDKIDDADHGGAMTESPGGPS